LSNNKNIPGPGLLKSLGYLLQMVGGDRGAVYRELFEKYGDIVSLRGPIKIAFLFHPEYVGHVLKENFLNYKKSISYKEFYPLIGQGLVTSEGKLWRTQRTLVRKDFRPQAIHAYIAEMDKITKELINEIESQLADRDKYDVNLIDMLGLHTYKIICRCLFNLEVGERELQLQKHALGLERYTTKRIFSILKWPLWVPTIANLKLKKSLKIVNKVVGDIIEHAKEDLDQSSPFLRRLILSGIDQQQIRDEIVTFLIAGHETTSNALAWTINLLATNPEVQQKLIDQVADNYSGESLDIISLQKMSYVRNVVSESMRILPPVPFLSRQNINSDVIGGYKINKETIVICAQAITHLDERFHKDAKQFNPDRFNLEMVKYSYFPFAEGPRKCIGEDFAIQEMMIFLIGFFQKFTVKLQDKFTPIPAIYITMKPKNGMLVSISSRN